jgi:hypothetical protein
MSRLRKSTGVERSHPENPDGRMQVIRQGNQNSLFPASKLPPYNVGVVSTRGFPAVMFMAMLTVRHTGTEKLRS